MCHPIVLQMRLSDEQKKVACARGRDIVVTAGAGTGKTLTLVARYLSLLAEGMPLRSVVAITFTKKAAREMRNRVRREMGSYLSSDLTAAEAEFWQRLYIELDAARIGTIHSLCTEILRAHPAEAKLDPRFEVLDENMSNILRQQALDEALAWAADKAQVVGLFSLLGERGLHSALAKLLQQRLDARAAFERLPTDPCSYWRQVLSGEALTPLDDELARMIPGLRKVFTFACERYHELKRELNKLDFDDLEEGALRLLRQSTSVRVRWQTEINAILVDEFQDTNGRQRDLLALLNGNGGKLFIVGDAQQSIYRFRGADVAVFRAERERIRQNGGLCYTLDTSYRAHRDLIQGLNDLFRPVLGESADPDRPWAEPLTPLRPHRQKPRPDCKAPYIELLLTVGTKSGGALDRAAEALAARIAALNKDGIDYGDMAILCRASRSFGPYEDALDRAGIPFLTVAGRGFYHRPEIRDLLNVLQAVADPTDDLALVGLLRSPAFALSDAAIYCLREEHKGYKQDIALWDILPKTKLSGQERVRLTRAIDIVSDLHKRAGRVSVADLLKAFLDATDYRAALIRAGQHRAARNVAKLLADAHASSLVSVGEFLEYVSSLRDSGAHEGEARALAEGAVQIMSVHAAKGLEFSVVVIGDITYTARGSNRVLIDPELGVLLPLKDENGELPTIYREGRKRDKDQDAAESDRLFYVAATRAREKLILSGCIRRLNKDGTLAKREGWLGEIAGSPGLGLEGRRIEYDEEGTDAVTLDLQLGQTPVRCTIYEPGWTAQVHAQKQRVEGVLEEVPLPPPLLAPIPFLEEQVDARTREQDRRPPRRVWQVVSGSRKAPAWVVGALVHEALAAWRFPDDTFETWVRARARGYGLTDVHQLDDAVCRTRRLLQRFRGHELFKEMDSAQRRLHEVPYSLKKEGSVESGIIDALYLRDGIWTIVEFKTDELQNGDDSSTLLDKEGYREQAKRYIEAAERLLGQRPRFILCMLDYAGKIELRDICQLGLDPYRAGC